MLVTNKRYIINLLVFFLLLCLSSLTFAEQSRDTSVLVTTPEQIYGPPQATTQLRLGNGGAGPTGIIKALAEDYISTLPQKNSVNIAWYHNISPLTLELLKKRIIDIALVYEPEQIAQAVSQGWATHRTLIFNDHFIIVGPRNNPAHLLPTDSPVQAFTKIAKTGQQLTTNNPQGLFFSRDDNSATNVKEFQLWGLAHIVPMPSETGWYRQAPISTQAALLNADRDGLYTLTDRGSWITNRTKIKNSVIYIQGGKLLQNPCVALLGKNPSPLAVSFLQYLTSSRAQKLIANYDKQQYGDILFTPAAQPEFTTPLQS